MSLPYRIAPVIGLVVALLSWLPSAVADSQSNTPLTNRLKDHPAPYLALHGDDPVAWQEWNAETVERARRENKVLLLSVGYFACHWCHVMQRESYQDKDVAEVLNQHFIAVKIDRELEPALDNRLMGFAQRTSGRGGWPLNVFITPDGHPIHAVLYLPQPQFLQLLQRVQAVWQEDPQRVMQLVIAEATSEFPDVNAELDQTGFTSLLSDSVAGVLSLADTLAGGFGEQNKFPSAPQLQYLLAAYSELDSNANELREPLQEFLTTTLDAMQALGLNDHLQGGFFRYTVDPSWAIPHFEKMLYDNAALALLYLRAATYLQRPDYLRTATTTLDFMRERMLHADGAMVASFSAVDEQGVEGGNYLWQLQELKQRLSTEEFQLVVAVWGLGRTAELEAGNHPRVFRSVAQYAEANQLDPSAAAALFDSAKAKLSVARDLRPLPVDDKLLAGWNGLALTAFAAAAAHPELGHYRAVAEALKDFLMTRLWDGKQLSRALVKGKLYGSASLEDYAYVGQGLLAWAELSQQADDYRLAQQVIEQGWQRFYKNNGWFLEDGTLLAPPSAVEVMADRSTPSPAGVLLQSTLQLAEQLDDSTGKERALAALNRGQELLRRAPFWYVSQMQALKVALGAGD